MSDQFSLFDAPAAPAPRAATDRLFFALYPDEDSAARIAEQATSLKARLGLKGRLLEPHRLHVTLNHVDDFDGLPPEVLSQARQAGDALAEQAFDIGFERAETFKRPSNLPFVLRGNEQDLAGVLAFQKRLGLAMAKAGLGRYVERSFTPHVTLMYTDRAVPSQAIEPLRWRVREFVLVHSLIGQHKHLMLGRWALNE